MTTNEALPWVYDDGGRKAAGYKGSTGDCVVRSIAIATGLAWFNDYETVYRELADRLRGTKAAARAKSKASRYKTSPRDGVPMPVVHDYLRALGWVWAATMTIGAGTTVHLADGELPLGRLVVRCSKHLTAVVNGVIHDTHDPSRDGTRAVYGYWYDPEVSFEDALAQPLGV